MKVLLIGSGAREHAIALALKSSEGHVRLFYYGKHANPGIRQLCEAYQIGSETDITAIHHLARNWGIDFAICGPEAPLSQGLADTLENDAIPVIGPNSSQAQIESSKYFARQMLARISPDIVPRFWHFPQYSEQALQRLKQLGEHHYVIKADGLYGGKGVKIGGDHLHDIDQAIKWCQQLNGPFVIEEKLEGPEFSLMTLTDGEHVKHMPLVQDYKRAYENGEGPNTGGMGSYSAANHSLPFVNHETLYQAQQINELTLHEINRLTDSHYQGILYGGFIQTRNGLKLIEYNCRFGDPEALNVLTILNGDFFDICVKLIEHRLHEADVRFQPLATVCKYLVPEGYPQAPRTNEEIIINNGKSHETIYHGAIQQSNQHYQLLGSRALAVVGVADNIAQAENNAESLASLVQGPVYHRHDIGKGL